MKFRYTVKLLCDIKQKKPKCFLDINYEINDYCAVASALNMGIVDPINFYFGSPEDFQFINWKESHSFCIVRERLHE